MLKHLLFKCVRRMLPFALALLCLSAAVAQEAIVVKGTVRSDSTVLENASVALKNNPKIAVRTNQKGEFVIKVPANGTLVVTYVGYVLQEAPIQGNPVVNIIMKANDDGLNDVVVGGFGVKTKKTSLVSSITSIDPKELKGPTSNLTTMLAGRISGMIAYQRSGEPGQDNASFFIRGLGSFGSGKTDPLILIDGMESTATDMARLQPDDIASFSVLKDASAAAVYGARGANGVVIISTKSGAEGKTKLNFRDENSVSQNARNFKFADNITYMKLANEAVLTRGNGATPYTQAKIDHTAAGDNPDLYPNNNWIKQLIRDYTFNQRYNLNVSGGAKNAQYYIAGTYNVDNGVLNVDKVNNFNSNIKLKNYSIRSNTNVKLTKSTEAILRVYGQFDDYNGPVGGGSAVFNSTVWSNPVLFPAVYSPSYLPFAKHPLFGNSIRLGGSTNWFRNPYADAVSGYQQYNTSTMQAQLELKQDLSSILTGLNARIMTYTQRYAYFSVSRSYNPFYYYANSLDGKAVNLVAINDGSPTALTPTGTEYLNYTPGTSVLNTTTYTEAAINYNHSFGDNAVSGMVLTNFRNYLSGNGTSLQSSLPKRNQGVSGRFTYGYKGKYLTEFNFGYNGSERFAPDHRYGFFPSGGVAWNISNEDFFFNIRPIVSKLKLRATYGLIGNDAIADENTVGRFFYLSEVNPNNGGYGATFGTDYGYNRPGYSLNRYANPNITWEISRQLNMGMDLTLFKNLNIVIDVYRDQRSNILLTRSYVPTTMGLQATVYANVGKAERKGIDLAMDYNKTFGKYWIQARANMTFATSKITEYDEPSYADAGLSNLSRKGHSLTQAFGYVAERLFTDATEVSNSPTQFGTPNVDYGAGDIKYRDINGDGRIDGNDIVPLGFPTSPELVYGFGFSAGGSSFDFSAFFQGSARSSFFIKPTNISPFILNGGRDANDNTIFGSQNGLLKVVADNHWSEDNRNPYAFFPRLSNNLVTNNIQTSNWWMRNGSFIRLKTVELGYNLPKNILTRLKMASCRVYANGSNLWVGSMFKMWDPEMGGNGLGYPVQSVYNLGVNLGF